MSKLKMDIYAFKDMSYYDKLQYASTHHKDKYFKCVCEYSSYLNALAYELDLLTMELLRQGIKSPKDKKTSDLIAYGVMLYRKLEDLKSLK